MLNELALIRNGIAALDESLLATTHKHLQEPGKSNLLRVVLSQEGNIDELDYLTDDRNKNHWSHGQGNQSHFPAVKLPFPLRPSGLVSYADWRRKSQKKSIEDSLAFLSESRNAHPFTEPQASWPDYRPKLEQRAKIYQKLSGDAGIIAQLINTFLAIDGMLFLRELDEELWSYCQRNPTEDLLKLAALIWFANGENLDSKGNMQDGKRPTLLLDLKSSNSYSAADKKWLPELSRLLFDNELSGDISKGNCSISGQTDIKVVDDTFPSLKCNHLGKVIIFSRKKETPTYQRYKQKGSESMMVSSTLADEMASALKYLNSYEKGTTWDIVPGEKTGIGDLLLAYCKDIPDLAATKLLAYEVQELDDEDDYEQEAKQICEMWKGKSLSLAAQVDYVIIRKVSDGVQKTIFSSSQSLANLEQAARCWVDGCKNTPPLKIALFQSKDDIGKTDEGNKEKKLVFSSPKPISPKRLAMLFKRHYARDLSKKAADIPGLPFAEIMLIFLNQNTKSQIATQLLKRLLRQYSNLLSQVATERLKHKRAKSIAHHHRNALSSIVAISIFLNKLNRNKEKYMNEISYKLGQFYSALDELHIGYCVSERGGQIPERLLGNQAYAVAVSNPSKALNIIAQRLAIYQAWAYKKSLLPNNQLADRNIINAKYAYRWLKRHCNDMHKDFYEHSDFNLPTHQAELLLGYIAGRPIDSEGKPDKSITKDNGDIKND